MTNKEIVEEARAVREMNEREAEKARMMPEEITVQQRANELVLRIGRMGDDELMSRIFKEALMNERRIGIEAEREACAEIACMVKEELSQRPEKLQYGRTQIEVAEHIETEIRARSS